MSHVFRGTRSSLLTLWWVVAAGLWACGKDDPAPAAIDTPDAGSANSGAAGEGSGDGGEGGSSDDSDCTPGETRACDVDLFCSPAHNRSTSQARVSPGVQSLSSLLPPSPPSPLPSPAAPLLALPASGVSIAAGAGSSLPQAQSPAATTHHNVNKLERVPRKTWLMVRVSYVPALVRPSELQRR